MIMLMIGANVFLFVYNAAYLLLDNYWLQAI